MNMDNISKKRYNCAFLSCLFLVTAGIVMGDYRTIPEGMKTIFYSNAILTTDYVGLVGTAAAFFNVALVLFFSTLIMRLNKLPMNGKCFFVLGLMAGFAFFGKNVFTMWFILLGTVVLSIVTKESLSKYIVIGLLATSLGPIIGVVYLHNGVSPFSLFMAMIVGIIIGFISPLLANHTAGILKGLNLYNGGFAVGLLALVIVPALMDFYYVFETEGAWATGLNFQFSIFLYLSAALCILIGYMSDKENAFKNYKNLLKRPGVAGDDFTELDGLGAVMVNMGINIAICTSYVLVIGGDLNGGTMGGIFTIAGFSANGKHAKNITPIMLGIFLGGVLNPSASPQTPGVQMATFLGTTLAPMAGTYGFVGGVLVGIFHSFTILKIGRAYSGANLYNNGFCGGIISVAIYPVFDRFFKKNTYNTPSPSQVKKNKEQQSGNGVKSVEAQ